ncbi:MAG: hypothetical protein FVQ80_03035 [Planctomycetes bacterium]|nr:hypothetical protein [Planctomycetota bacterium]
MRTVVPIEASVSLTGFTSFAIPSLFVLTPLLVATEIIVSGKILRGENFFVTKDVIRLIAQLLESGISIQLLYEFILSE